MTLMQRRRALMATKKKSILPPGYAECDYIKVPDTPTRYDAYIKLDARNNVLQYADVLYSFYMTTSKHIFISFGASKVAPYGGYSANNGYTTTITDDSGHKKAHMVRGSNIGTVINIICGWKDAVYTGYPLIYRFTLVDKSNNTIFDGIPAKRKSDNAYGLFDLVSETFRPSDGAVAFEGG